MRRAALGTEVRCMCDFSGDIPLNQVVERAKGVWEKKHPDLVSRTEFVGGSFFDQGAVVC